MIAAAAAAILALTGRLAAGAFKFRRRRVSGTGTESDSESARARPVTRLIMASPCTARQPRQTGLGAAPDGRARATVPGSGWAAQPAGPGAGTARPAGPA